MAAADECERERKLVDAIKLYNLAGAHETVIACLTRALGDLLSEPSGGGEEGASLEALTRSILEHYSRRGEVVGAQRQDLVCLLKIREATVACEQKRYEAALEVCIVILAWPCSSFELTSYMFRSQSRLLILFHSMVIFKP